MAVQASTIVAARNNIELDTNVSRYLFTGLFSVLMLIGGIGCWAALINLAGAVIASGSVVVSGNVKKIQHPTGGVVGDILVRNGDRVSTGDVLMRLDQTITKANLSLVSKQMDELAGRKARLEAERDGLVIVSFPESLLIEANHSDVAASETSLFESRRKTRLAQKDQLAERIDQLRKEISGIETQIQAKRAEVILIGKELDGLEVLEKKRLVTTTKLMALRREGARLAGEEAQLTAAAAQAKGKIAEIELQRLNIDNEAQSEIVSELRDAEARLGELAERKTAAVDQLMRVDIRSPTDGIVHQLAVHTVGGVINPAEPIMLIVPATDQLIIEARIDPQDIDQAREHTKAMLRFTAFDQGTTPQIGGQVTNVSADLAKDQQTGLAYYVARIEIAGDEMAKLQNLRLVPGMPVDVMIQTAERSALSYFTKPILDQFAKAFRER